MYSEIDMKTFGENLFHYRKLAGLTQAQLAKQVGISSAFLSQVECGNKLISLPVLWKIAQALNVSADAIIVGTRKDARIENICLLMAGSTDATIEKAESIVRTLVEK